ncbi:AAA family ATPase [Streptomyces erythrochromogenes]|uniref:AAA family ATPase n=1 Tax=Streptomyces erythrochromogenes TaxID=285574 RepID=UPI0036D1674F
MEFQVLEWKATIPQAHGAYLVKDSWNDHGFVTTFNLLVRLQDASVVKVGFLRIGHAEMTKSGWNRTSDRLPDRFTSLDDGYFSLGMEDDYYEALRLNLSRSMAHEILYALKDAAYAQPPDQATLDLQVFSSSLLRGRTYRDLLRTRQVALGVRARIVPFKWSYTPEQKGLLPAPRLTFESKPASLPPTNLHALIGRNGVGKSSLLHAIASAAANVQLDVEDDPDPGGDAGRFASCVVIGFSPFDRHSYAFADDAGIPFHFIRLRHQHHGRLKSDEELKGEFVRSFAIARVGARGVRWRKAIETLNYGASGFLDGDMDVIDAMIREHNPSRLEREMGRVFENLSSGHKVVLLMVTRLIEVVSERTLVLIDEPETHLHPPLLAALTNALSNLLADRNGMAVVATHSPVVLQEVPASCVHALERHGDELTARRPDLETYGESVGELTYDVFGLEVTSTGFHAAIAAEVANGGTYADITRRFTGLGAEARALLRAMTFSQARGER